MEMQDKNKRIEMNQTERDNKSIQLQGTNKVAVGLIISFFALKFLVEFSLSGNWGSWTLYLTILFVIISLIFSIWILLNKKASPLYKILGILGIVLLIYTSFI